MRPSVRTHKVSSKSQYENCPLCESIQLKDKWSVCGFTLTKCNDCSGLFVRDQLTLRFIKDFYDDLETNAVYTDKNKELLNYYYRKLIDEIHIIKNEPHRDEKPAILDVGCASGYFLELMEGWERHGVEVSEKHADSAKRKIFGKSIFCGLIEDYPVTKKRFDVITFQDSFDHLVNPRHILQKSHDLLKPEGLIVIKVHNFSCLYAKLTGSKFYAILPPMHLFYFNETSLIQLLERSGYRWLKSRFIGHMLALETVLFRLSSGNQYSIFYHLYKLIKGTKIGRIPVYKQFNDIITIFAVKEAT